jgi:RNA polymerase sigma-70 factor (ECF subfamily)
MASRGSPTPDAGEEFVRALFEEHAPALLAHTTRLTGDRAGAEDIVQETLLRAWRHSGRLAADPRPLRPWLLTVAHRLALDRRRAVARAAETSDDALAGLAGADAFDRALDSWQLSEAMGRLSAEHRAVLLEVYYRGRSVAEASSALGIPPGTVKSRTYYALRALRLVLEETGWTA